MNIHPADIAVTRTFIYAIAKIDITVGINCNAAVSAISEQPAFPVIYNKALKFAVTIKGRNYFIDSLLVS